jgi:hypothetical protein
MTAAGFVDVTETRYRLPIGPWATDPTEKQIGRLNMLNYLEGVEAYTLACCGRSEGFGVEEAKTLAERARRDVLDKKLELWHWL